MAVMVMCDIDSWWLHASVVAFFATVPDRDVINAKLLM